MNQKRVWIWLGWIGMGLVVAAGCGQKGPQTYPVSGTVTFDGQPIPEGRISFVPEDGKAAPDSAPIVQGKFQFQVKAGRHRVEIVADRPTGKVDPVMGMAPRESYIPACYNSQTILRAEVTPQGPNQFTFELKSQGQSRP
ncbi:MAG: hypothetical protein NZ602_03235 [Thermoguttaceae bacterium]|nr:hypothetical protein [Thermoguttaceae bacterium]MDW8037918.1 hypothetical protein [Thermoguttaceae bacterium]